MDMSLPSSERQDLRTYKLRKHMALPRQCSPSRREMTAIRTEVYTTQELNYCSLEEPRSEEDVLYM